MGTAQHINYEAKVAWLEGQAANIYSQFGEDGLVACVLGKIGETNRCCFEIGAADGLFFSNTLRLRERGWRAVLFEKDYTLWRRCYDTYSSETVQVLSGSVVNLNKALKYSIIQHVKTPDFGVIDIDGQDYWMWYDLTDYRPRVMLVEYRAGNLVDAVPERGSDQGQAGLYAIEELGKEKGYTLVATTLCNALFVDVDELKNAGL